MSKGPHPGPYSVLPTGKGQRNAMVIGPRLGPNGAAAVAIINEYNVGDVNETAQFIARACNCHAELVAALEEINRIALGHPYAGVTCGEVARAALARAKGEA